MHFVLQARECSRVAIGIELVVQLEDHAQRIFRMRRSLEMPRAFAEEVPPLADLQTQVRHIAELCDICGNLQHLAGPQGAACVRSCRRKCCRTCWLSSGCA